MDKTESQDRIYWQEGVPRSQVMQAMAAPRAAPKSAAGPKRAAGCPRRRGGGPPANRIWRASMCRSGNSKRSPPGVMDAGSIRSRID